MKPNRKLVFDIETNMLDHEDPKWDNANWARNVKSVACLCAIDADTGEQFIFHDNPDLARDGTNEEGVEFLLTAAVLVGHNIRGFDIPSLQEMYPQHKDALEGIQKADTLVMARDLFSWNTLLKYDEKHKIKHDEKSSKALNSLGAWGNRLSSRLGLPLAKNVEFNKNANWANLEVNQLLIDYCLQDVVVNVKVFDVMVKTHLHNKKVEENE